MRELALRRTADRVDAQAREYREDAAISGVWQLKERLLVAVGPGAHAEQVVRAGRRLADSLRAEWIAVYVETPRLQRLPDAERSRILRALHLAQELGAETATLPGQNVADALADYAGERNAGKIVLGRSSVSPFLRPFAQTLFDTLAGALPASISWWWEARSARSRRAAADEVRARLQGALARLRRSVAAVVAGHA